MDCKDICTLRKHVERERERKLNSCPIVPGPLARRCPVFNHCENLSCTDCRPFLIPSFLLPFAASLGHPTIYHCLYLLNKYLDSLVSLQPGQLVCKPQLYCIKGRLNSDATDHPRGNQTLIISKKLKNYVIHGLFEI